MRTTGKMHLESAPVRSRPCALEVLGYQFNDLLAGQWSAAERAQRCVSENSASSAFRRRPLARCSSTR